MSIVVVKCKNALNLSLQAALRLVELLSHQKGYLLSILIVIKMLNTFVYQLKGFHDEYFITQLELFSKMDILS